MTNSKATKKALFTSMLSLLLCFTMLMGTTFAWFTDTVTSGRNLIQSGNLDVVLEYKTDWADDWAVVDENTKLFKEDALYEPGYTEVVFLRVSNAGNLALKYNLNVNVNGEKTSTNVNNETFSLKDYLEIGYYIQDEMSSGANYADVLMPGMFGSREAALSNVTTTKLSSDTGIVRADSPVLAGNDTAQVVAMVLTMPETVGNEANHKSDVEAPYVDLGVTLLATQYTEEKDSFDNQYDKDAEYPVVKSYDYVVNSLDELKDAFANGGNILLNDDITFDNMIKIENGVEVYLDMNGKTIEFTPDALFKPGNPLLYPLAGTKLTITGNGTFDLGDNFDAALVYPAGEVIIENGTFIRNRVPEGTDPDEVQTMFMGVKSVGSSVVIKDGYFDGGYYDANADLKNFTETDQDIANRGKSADKNTVRTAIKNNTSLLLNLSWSSETGTQDFRIYGGTFVGANPAWGDEGCAMPITPDYLRPWSYYQGTFLDGQKMCDDKIELPDGYSITEGKTADGRPTYTVNYSK